MDKRLKFINENGEESDDLLNSDVIIQNFQLFLNQSSHSVYAVSGDWGAGKTSFIQMWKQYYSDKQKYVDIDAFRCDYETEPFIMLIKAFKEAMEIFNIDESNKEKWLNKAKEIVSVKNIAKLGLNIIAERTIGIDAVKEFINDTTNSCFDKLTKEKSLYEELTEILKEIAVNGFDNRIFIIIDELDRCRPDFALETLERIKHIFNAKNVTFILVYNEIVMKSIIKQKYGFEIDAKKYLDKFVQKTFYFNNMKHFKNWYIRDFYINYGKTGMDLFFFLQNNSHIIELIREYYNLTFRDIQRMLAQLIQYEKYAKGESRCAAVVSIEILKKVNENEYNEMIKYFNENNGQFASNTPNRFDYKKIYDLLCTNLNKNFKIMEPDEAFYDTMEYYN
jgi:predicted KAP-like P-loop ATPase